jgi:hypothetical protein
MGAARLLAAGKKRRKDPASKSFLVAMEVGLCPFPDRLHRLCSHLTAVPSLSFFLICQR